MGVWIETIVLVVYPASSESHPVWVCGLKPLYKKLGRDLFSHTLYGCVD